MTLRELYEVFRRSKGVCTDSRGLVKNRIFFALKGPNFDGNDYVRDALKRGALIAVCNQSPFQRKNQRIVLVKDSTKILQKLATHHRQEIGAKVVAITGSNGKTTTRSLALAMLQKKYKAIGTIKNYNNDIGVPLTILNAPVDTELMVIEMGANHVGEIAKLCEIAEPNLGLITNIGNAHLEGFGGIEGVKVGKSELYRYLSTADGQAFVDGKEDHLLELSTVVYNKIFYNQQFNTKYSALKSHFLNVTETEALSFDMKTRKEDVHIDSKLQGLYNIKNVCSAVTIAEYFDVDFEDIIDVLRNFDELENRSSLIELSDIRLII